MRPGSSYSFGPYDSCVRRFNPAETNLTGIWAPRPQAHGGSTPIIESTQDYGGDRSPSTKLEASKLYCMGRSIYRHQRLVENYYKQCYNEILTTLSSPNRIPQSLIATVVLMLPATRVFHFLWANLSEMTVADLYKLMGGTVTAVGIS